VSDIAEISRCLGTEVVFGLSVNETCLSAVEHGMPLCLSYKPDITGLGGVMFITVVMSGGGN